MICATGAVVEKCGEIPGRIAHAGCRGARYQLASALRPGGERRAIFMPWEILKRGSEDLSSEVLAIHAALLPTNEILLFGGDEFNPAQNPGAVDNSRLFVGGE